MGKRRHKTRNDNLLGKRCAPASPQLLAGLSSVVHAKPQTCAIGEHLALTRMKSLRCHWPGPTDHRLFRDENGPKDFPPTGTHLNPAGNWLPGTNERLHSANIGVCRMADEVCELERPDGNTFPSLAGTKPVQLYARTIGVSGKRGRKPEICTMMASNTRAKAAQAGLLDARGFCCRRGPIDIWSGTPDWGTAA
jgi:hypothetical protein